MTLFPTFDVYVYIVGVFVILGAAYFYVIWDCARKNFKEIVEIVETQDEIISAILRILINCSKDHGFDTDEIEALLNKYDENNIKIKEHKL